MTAPRPTRHCDLHRLAFLAVILILPALGCGRPPAGDSPATTPFIPDMVGERPGLHNVIRLTDRLYSGSSPEGEAGFQSLRDLGIKTVISVDGAKPDVLTAARYGLHYVHLPVGYDGVPRESAVRIARAVCELPGPAYIHCHHGRHRGPAAAVMVIRCIDSNCPAEAALSFLKIAGTDPKYAGLFASVKDATPATSEEWHLAGGEFPEIARTPDLVRLMVEIDERWDVLKLVRSAGWKSPHGHPGIDPIHETVLLNEHFRETNRSEAVRNRNEEFRQLMLNATEASASLQQAVSAVPVRTDDASHAFNRIAGFCVKCHEQHRDK